MEKIENPICIGCGHDLERAPEEENDVIYPKPSEEKNYVAYKENKYGE